MWDHGDVAPGGMNPEGCGTWRFGTWRMRVRTSYLWQEELCPNLLVRSPAEVMSSCTLKQLLEGNSSFMGWCGL